MRRRRARGPALRHSPNPQSDRQPAIPLRAGRRMPAWQSFKASSRLLQFVAWTVLPVMTPKGNISHGNLRDKRRRHPVHWRADAP